MQHNLDADGYYAQKPRHVCSRNLCPNWCNRSIHECNKHVLFEKSTTGMYSLRGGGGDAYKDRRCKASLKQVG